jgi:hypothetical protein
MSLEDFIKDVSEEYEEEIDEVRKLQEILDQLARQENEIYLFSVTSDL